MLTLFADTDMDMTPAMAKKYGYKLISMPYSIDGKTVYPYRYVGSPLSGRVELEGRCDCGWSGFETASGWFKRGESLREQLAADKLRHNKYKLLHLNAEPATIDELLAWLKQ